MSRSIACNVFACFLVVASHGALADNDEENEAFDEALAKIVSQLKAASLNTLTIPDFDIFEYIVMKGGQVSNLSTIKRDGDADVESLSGGGVKLTGKVSFTDLEIQADELDFNLPLLPVIGKDSAVVKIATNQFNFDVEYATDTDGNCQVTVGKFEATALNDISISYKTFSVINWLASYVAPLFLNALSNTLVTLLGESATAVGQKVLGGLNLCASL